jgi:hypothetical protein
VFSYLRKWTIRPPVASVSYQQFVLFVFSCLHKWTIRPPATRLTSPERSSASIPAHPLLSAGHVPGAGRLALQLPATGGTCLHGLSRRATLHSAQPPPSPIGPVSPQLLRQRTKETAVAAVPVLMKRSVAAASSPAARRVPAESPPSAAKVLAHPSPLDLGCEKQSCPMSMMLALQWLSCRVCRSIGVFELVQLLYTSISVEFVAHRAVVHAKFAQK